MRDLRYHLQIPSAAAFVIGLCHALPCVRADTPGRETLTFKGHTGTVTSVAFSPDGKQLDSASVDKTVKVWDVTSMSQDNTSTQATRK